MKVKEALKQVMPGFIKTKILSIIDAKELKKFNALPKANCDSENLMSVSNVSLPELFSSETINDFWKDSKKEMDRFSIPDGTGGVNPGDRKALYYLLCHFKPSSILEVGTHIGASTIHIATALIKNGNNGKLTTVDIRDVNSSTEKPWLEYGTKYSPREMVNTLNYGDLVSFEVSNSDEYLEKSNKKFDFIFLDGDHSATTVYKEIPLALKLLNKNGIILLHDYYPNGVPLWSNGTVISGPYIATKRLIEEGADLTVLPLGNLPWPTKLNSNLTSLALLMKKN